MVSENIPNVDDLKLKSGEFQLEYFGAVLDKG